MLAQKLMGGGTAADKLYVDDVFSTYTYAGTGATQTITNGIDLSGKGGMVWTKCRNTAYDNVLCDTTRGATKIVRSNMTTAQETVSNSLTAFGNTGYTLGGGWYVTNNVGGINYVSWTFREAPKFFDIVTYTGNGAASRTIAHSLGAAPGMIFTKGLSVGRPWRVWHRSLATNNYLDLSATAAAVSDSTVFTSTAPTSTEFYVGNAEGTNENGTTYVAYLFAHDTATDGLIQCGSFTTDGSDNATVTLGWEPQYVLAKRTNSTGNWVILDQMRGWNTTANDAYLHANATDAEATNKQWGEPTATGFNFMAGIAGSSTYIYMAIRRPNKPPTTGTEVFKPHTYTEGISGNQVVGFAPDTAFQFRRGDMSLPVVWDKLRGLPNTLLTNSTAAESVGAGYGHPFGGFSNTGFTSGFLFNNTSGTQSEVMAFKRAPGFFDVVAYTGTGAARTINHSLGVAPEMIITKARSIVTGWGVYHSQVGPTKALSLNSAAIPDVSNQFWNDTAPTASVFSVRTWEWMNTYTGTYVAYLFATLPGISKVGSYTGNGSSQTINCGFTTGARFILIKRTDAAGDWYTFDAARGIVAGNDPHVSLNSTVAEVTTDDSVDPDSTGFIVNQVAATNINVNGATYIFLSIS